MRQFLLFSLLALLLVPLALLAQEDRVQVLDLDDRAVIGEIEDLHLIDFYCLRPHVLVHAQNHDRRFVESLRIIDKEVFEKLER